MCETTQTERVQERKWTTSAGPRQSKQVEEAIRAIMSKGRSYTEITDHGRHSYNQPFSAPSAESVAALRAVGERFDYQITRTNYQSVITALNEARASFEIPVYDKRSTPEQLEKQRIENERLRAEQEAKARDKAAAKAAALEKLRAEYPNAIPGDASKNCKAELRAKFPGIKFSVKASHFSGGNSLDVSWWMGPTTKEVDAVIGKYKAGSFNSMDDSYDYDHSAESDAIREVLGQMKYVGSDRDYDQTAIHIIVEAMAEIAGDEVDMESWYRVSAEKLTGRSGDDYRNVVHGLLGVTSFPPGAVVTGVELETDEEKHTHEWTSRYRIVYDVPASSAGSVASMGEAAEPVQGSGYEIQKHWHDKRRFDFWLIVPAERMSSELFDAKRSSCEAAGGWYSRKWGKTPGGFAFKSEEAAKSWAAAAFGG